MPADIPARSPSEGSNMIFTDAYGARRCDLCTSRAKLFKVVYVSPAEAAEAADAARAWGLDLEPYPREDCGFWHLRSRHPSPSRSDTAESS